MGISIIFNLAGPEDLELNLFTTIALARLGGSPN
jgi:hypothetical protein